MVSGILLLLALRLMFMLSSWPVHKLALPRIARMLRGRAVAELSSNLLLRLFI